MFLAAVLTGVVLGLGNPVLVFSVFTETSKLLVCYWRSRVLRESGSGPEDEPVGQVRCTPHSLCGRVVLGLKMAPRSHVCPDPP